MDIQIVAEAGKVPVTVMSVVGNIDTNSFQQFQKKAEELIADGAQYILVDLSKVPYMSSAGLRVLSALFNQLRAKYSKLNEDEVLHAVNDGTYKSPNLKLLNLSEQTRFAFETAGFDMFIETYDDLRTAINSFTG
ncbi:MAG: STAS domain-containing protein [Anaerolineales bacterium]|nr:STAS domain-containing protein [Anaerolineales bacterium]MCZ2122299.1 STAS domain-containing protein [Anaerolineales bacterium]